MIAQKRDTQRVLAAAQLIFDGRAPERDMGAVLTTLEGVVALVLLSVMGNDARRAAGMLNEGLTPGVESRIAQAAGGRAGARQR